MPVFLMEHSIGVFISLFAHNMEMWSALKTCEVMGALATLCVSDSQNLSFQVSKCPFISSNQTYSFIR